MRAAQAAPPCLSVPGNGGGGGRPLGGVQPFVGFAERLAQGGLDDEPCRAPLVVGVGAVRAPPASAGAADAFALVAQVFAYQFRQLRRSSGSCAGDSK